MGMGKVFTVAGFALAMVLALIASGSRAEPHSHFHPIRCGGVLVDEQCSTGSMVLLDNTILRVGDRVPSYPGICVEDVSTTAVIMNYQGQRIHLSLSDPPKSEENPGTVDLRD